MSTHSPSERLQSQQVLRNLGVAALHLRHQHLPNRGQHTYYLPLPHLPHNGESSTQGMSISYKSNKTVLRSLVTAISSSRQTRHHLANVQHSPTLKPRRPKSKPRCAHEPNPSSRTAGFARINCTDSANTASLARALARAASATAALPRYDSRGRFKREQNKQNPHKGRGPNSCSHKTMNRRFVNRMKNAPPT